MNRLNRICEELYERAGSIDTPTKEACTAFDAFEKYNRIRRAVRHYTRGGPVTWYNYCDICGNIWPHPDQSSHDCDFGHPCPACGRPFDRLLVVDEGDPGDVRVLDGFRLYWEHRRRQEAVAQALSARGPAAAVEVRGWPGSDEAVRAWHGEGERWRRRWR